jgi:hypothetical protein
MEIMASVESGLYKAPVTLAQEVRFVTGQILNQARPPKPNLTVAEARALREIRNNDQIIVLPADKGNTTVVMDRSDYNDVMRKLLSDPSYKQLKSDPTKSIERKTNKIVTGLPDIDETTRKQLKSSDAYCSRMYGLPKIHKGVTPPPMRPIVNTMLSSTYRLAGHLASRLRPFTSSTEHHIKDSAHLIQKLQQVKAEEGDLLVSFDVKSLFTRVPVTETVQLIETMTSRPVAEAVHHCLATTVFICNGSIYQQTEGCAMGSPLSPVCADIYMEWFEQQVMERSTHKPTLWWRYVDDIFSKWPHGREKLHGFLHLLNSIHPSIEFSMEIEEDGRLPFLDVLITRKQDGTLGHQVYRKPTHTDRYLHATSHHDPRQKTSVMRTLIHRARTVSEQDALGDELQHLRQALAKNGYNTAEINRALREKQPSPASRDARPPNQGRMFLPYIQGVTDKIGHILRRKGFQVILLPGRQVKQLLRSPKDPLPLTYPGVYEIPCGTCGKRYIGETGRTVKTRLREHQDDLRLGRTKESPVAEHAICMQHDVDIQKAKCLAIVANYHTRTILEGLLIQSDFSATFNRMRGRESSGVWKIVR